MQYIKPENLIFHNDALVTLEVLREHTLGCEGDEAVRLGILSKIDRRIAELKASVFERREANGSIRVRHPAIGVLCIDHETLKEPTQLFASHIKSLVAFTITISRADAIIGVDGLIDYEPYEEIARFKMTASAFSELITSPGRGHHPATFEFAKYYRIDPYLPDAMANSKHCWPAVWKIVWMARKSGSATWQDLSPKLLKNLPSQPSKPLLRCRNTRPCLSYRWSQALGTTWHA